VNKLYLKDQKHPHLTSLLKFTIRKTVEMMEILLVQLAISIEMLCNSPMPSRPTITDGAEVSSYLWHIHFFFGLTTFNQIYNGSRKRKGQTPPPGAPPRKHHLQGSTEE